MYTVSHFILRILNFYRFFLFTHFYRMKAYGGADSDESDPEVEEVDVEKLPPLEVGPDEHKLQYTYCLWYHRGFKVKNPSVSIDIIGGIDT